MEQRVLYIPSYVVKHICPSIVLLVRSCNCHRSMIMNHFPCQLLAIINFQVIIYNYNFLFPCDLIALNT